MMTCKIPIAIALIALSLFPSCSKEVNTVSTNTDQASTSQTNSLRAASPDGESAFREIFFLQGDIRKKLPYLADVQDEKDQYFANSPELQRQWNLLTDEIVAIIHKDNPVYFQEFQKGIESNDLYTVQKTLENASAVILKAQYASNAFRNNYIIGDYMIKDPIFRDAVTKLDLKTDAGRKEFERLINENKPLKQALAVNGLCYAVTVAWTIAGVVATVAAAVNVAAYATVIAKTAMFLWDKVKVFSKASALNDYYTTADIFVGQVAVAY